MSAALHPETPTPADRLLAAFGAPIAEISIDKKTKRGGTGFCKDCRQRRPLFLRNGVGLCGTCLTITSKVKLSPIDGTLPNPPIFGGSKGGGVGFLVGVSENSGPVRAYLPPRRCQFEDAIDTTNRLQILRHEAPEGDAVSFSDFLLQTIDLIDANPQLQDHGFLWTWIRCPNPHGALSAVLDTLSVDPDFWTLAIGISDGVEVISMVPSDWLIAAAFIEESQRENPAINQKKLQGYRTQLERRRALFVALHATKNQPPAAEPPKGKRRKAATERDKAAKALAKVDEALDKMRKSLPMLENIVDLDGVIRVMGSN